MLTLIVTLRGGGGGVIKLGVSIICCEGSENSRGTSGTRSHERPIRKKAARTANWRTSHLCWATGESQVATRVSEMLQMASPTRSLSFNWRPAPTKVESTAFAESVQDFSRKLTCPNQLKIGAKTGWTVSLRC